MQIPFYLLLFKTYHAQRRHNQLKMHDFRLSQGQPKVLRCIYTKENCKLKDIAEECDIEPATTSRILNSLESKGFILRKIDPGNKRAYQIKITKEGKQALERWNCHCEEVEKLSLKGFNDEEKKQFQDYLMRMYKNLTDE